MTIQPDARGKIYRRVTDGVEDFITVKEALAEVNDLVMNRKRDYREMSSGQGHHAIRYSDGRVVLLIEVDAPAEEEPATWTVASHRMLFHKFTEATGNGRAVCNRSFRPWLYGNGYDFKTRSAHESSQYADMYTFCPRCERKP
jgi:hypothetical protein